MKGHTSSRVKPLAASVAFEVFRLLVGDEELEIFKVAFACIERLAEMDERRSSGLTVVAPWTSEDVLDVGVAALLLAHLDDWIRFRGNNG